jgi:hypothetical protein
MNRLQGLPGTLLLRSLLVVILVSILVGLFLDRSDELSRQVQRSARRQALTRIRSLLGLRLLQAASSGRLDRLAALDRANPFEALASGGDYRPPQQYRGAIDDPRQAREPGWYFLSRQRVIRWFDGGQWLAEAWQLRLKYEDRNGNARFDPGVDVIEGLDMKKAAD